ncbi:DUF58 domain-containing protein [Xanthomonas citri pv. fuscans CFBP 6996]|uniref:DUF58 domain-containing protein n=1 Tax=Xanthomonas citri TaxID=346 RepID=UPI000C196DFF|nr:DUF58 domain-containing protein [Xanthomonas citri]ATS50838.1 DUF58 domain-containing protein [Xanthomonas citri pv. phaseoli var. fuscans]ATS56587.1 DUF58 domain-containing protein [Xanthomonas citri pv. phaseoli var. fuscans]ATS59404.1 DUF58 domain-containing protein [Xanthomonas citri pv. phaseoli var. fuscans]PTY31526.1 DUF58 domain-containing protein [Xanthomonas citri pv. fuscans CFBP 6996]QWN15463.1 DUF58 domain-containing protein [Xanthomonas citri]
MHAHMRGIVRRLSLLVRPRGAEGVPIVLDRRRIYVLPTRFGLFVTALLLAMLLGALNYNNNPALLLALLLATAGIASSIMAHLQLSALRIEAVSAEPVVAGEPLRMRVSLARRDTRARRGLRLDHLDRSGFCALIEHDMAEVDLLVPTERRGWQDIERIRLSSTQPLGLVRAWSWVWPETPLLAYPRPEEQGPALPDGAGSPNKTRLHAQGEELHQLRPYRAGDAPRTISWKHSARRDTLLVREYEQPLGIDVTLDWRALNALPYECRIARLARWVNLAERDGRRYRLLLPGQPPLGPAQGPSHHHLCQRALALLPHD